LLGWYVLFMTAHYCCNKAQRWLSEIRQL